MSVKFVTRPLSQHINEEFQRNFIIIIIIIIITWF
jgi:hypothetical protein